LLADNWIGGKGRGTEGLHTGSYLCHGGRMLLSAIYALGGIIYLYPTKTI